MIKKKKKKLFLSVGCAAVDLWRQLILDLSENGRRWSRNRQNSMRLRRFKMAFCRSSRNGGIYK